MGEATFEDAVRLFVATLVAGMAFGALGLSFVVLGAIGVVVLSPDSLAEPPVRGVLTQVDSDYAPETAPRQEM